METDDLKWDTIYSSLLVRLSRILQGLSYEETIRLIKILVEMLRMNSIPLGFLGRLFLALQEVDLNYDPPGELMDLVNDFITLRCEVDDQRTTVEQLTQKIDHFLSTTE